MNHSNNTGISKMNTRPDKQDYIEILERLGVLLTRNNYALQKNMLDEIITKLHNGEPRSIIRDSNDIFGGMGSVTDCSLLPPWSKQSQDEAEKDEQEFNALVSDLAELMCLDGIASDRVRDIGVCRAIWAGDSQKARRIKSPVDGNQI